MLLPRRRDPVSLLPVAHALGFKPLPLDLLAVLLGMAVAYLALVEVGKYFFFKSASSFGHSHHSGHARAAGAPGRGGLEPPPALSRASSVTTPAERPKHGFPTWRGLSVMPPARIELAHAV